MAIVVDSSVWIALLRGVQSPQTQRLHAIRDPEEILLGDIILLEVLQGARDEAHAAQIEARLREFPVANMLTPAFAPKVAKTYRSLRERGVTVRKTVDLIIGGFCIENGHRLLYADRDFDPMAEHLGLLVA